MLIYYSYMLHDVSHNNVAVLKLGCEIPFLGVWDIPNFSTCHCKIKINISFYPFYRYATVFHDCVNVPRK